MARVLIVDDEPQITKALRLSLHVRRHDVIVADDGTAALRRASDSDPDVIVLDIGLPDIDGIEVIHGIRGWSQIPIIVLSGQTGSANKIAALDAGADDYVTKPFNVEELLARIRAVVRRRVGEPVTVIGIGDHVVDLANRTITPELRLTPTQWKLVDILLGNPGKLITQHYLLATVWGPMYVRHSHYLRQYMAQLRRKFEPDPSRPRHLITEPGMGYRFQP